MAVLWPGGDDNGGEGETGVARREEEGGSPAKSSVLNLKEGCKQVSAQSEATCGRCGWGWG